MNTKLILIILVIAGLSSCSTVYKIKQTPDDVYYSPAPKQSGYIQSNSDDGANVYNSALPQDQQILLHIRSRRWRRIHGYDNDYPYGYGYYPYGNNYPVYVDPKTGTLPPSTYTAPRKYDLGAYKPKTGTGVGNFIRRVFNSPNSNIVNDNPNTPQGRTSQQSTNNTRTNSSTPSSSTRSTGSGSSGSAPVRSFHR